MRKLILALALTLGAIQFAAAADATCESKAADKHLAGAAKNSFMKKCEAGMKVTDASTACDAKAAEKKLTGAAKSSFVKKCIADAKGSK